ncbi:MAG: hypothetical protein CMI53_02915 [Parcubacteria group bacterium]|nr:hypothetical protein [Parcubacteria group bacterium]
MTNFLFNGIVFGDLALYNTVKKEMKMVTTVAEQIVEIISGYIGITKSELNERLDEQIIADSSIDSLGFDSLEFTELVMKLEEEFSLDLDIDGSFETSSSGNDEGNFMPTLLATTADLITFVEQEVEKQGK